MQLLRRHLMYQIFIYVVTCYTKDYMKKKAFIITVAVLLVIVALFVFAQRAGAPTQDNTQEPEQASSEPPKEIEQQPKEFGFNMNKYSIDEPGSPWWIVNRERPLPSGYVPPDLTVPSVRLRLGAQEEQMQLSGQATPALEAMFSAAQADGVELVFGSGYRSESLQRQFYESYVARDGQAEADRYSARPGTSEHQTGLAVDVTSPSGQCHLLECFEDTPQGQWVAENAHRFGFIIRYLEGKESVTGFMYEPWHLRYVGEELATELYNSGQTMEEFFGIVAYHPPVLALVGLDDCACCC